MAEINVKAPSSGDGVQTFEVSVNEGGTSSKHTVTLKVDYYEQLTGGAVNPGTLVEKSFEFLLEREPKESILGRFDLSVIERYFPEYPDVIKTYF